VKGLFTPALLVAALSISGCELTLDEKEKLDNAAADLQKLADQIIITYPAKDSEVSDSIVTVRADIPASAQAQEVRLLVDGIEVAKDSDGAPWEIQWPAYLFADGGKHTLLLKTVTGEGNEVRNNEQFQLTISEQANKALTFEEGINGRAIQDQGSLSFTFTEFEGASGYEILIDGDYDNLLISNTAEIELNNLNVGNHTVQYRVLHERLDSTPFSEEISFEVLPATLPTINEPVIDGVNTSISWEAISEGDSYEVFWGPIGGSQRLGTTIETSYTISELGFGDFEWAIRRTNPLGQKSEMSSLETIELLPPVLPIINEPLIELGANGYQVTLSWEAVVEGDNYEIFWGPKDNLLSMGTTQDSSYPISVVTLGNYEYALIRTNSLGQKSLISETFAINVGTFRTQLGGSLRDSASQIIPSIQGGYLIRATTQSYEISPQLNGTDDWIIRIDNNGKFVAEYISNAESTSFFSFGDMIETNDGSVYLVGNSDETKEAIIIKLSGDLEVVWEKRYRPEEVTGYYSFVKIIEWGDQLYVAATELTTANTQSNISNYLHAISVNTGAISSSIALPTISDRQYVEIRSLLVSNEEDLLISGSTDPINSSFPFARGAFLLSLDEDLEKIAYWDNADTGRHDRVGDVIELSNGRFAIVGESHMRSPAISIINADGSTEYRYFEKLSWGDYRYFHTNLVANNNGGFVGFFTDANMHDSRPMMLIQFDGNLAETNRSYLLDEATEYSSNFWTGFVKNGDESITLLFNSGATVKDLVIKRIPFNYDE